MKKNEPRGRRSTSWASIFIWPGRRSTRACRTPRTRPAIADIGRGTGWSSIGALRVAAASEVDESDLDASTSTTDAKANASGARLEDRVTFAVRNAGDQTWPEQYDFAWRLRTIHDVQPRRRSRRDAALAETAAPSHRRRTWLIPSMSSASNEGRTHDLRLQRAPLPSRSPWPMRHRRDGHRDARQHLPADDGGTGQASRPGQMRLYRLFLAVPSVDRPDRNGAATSMFTRSWNGLFDRRQRQKNLRQPVKPFPPTASAPACGTASPPRR